MRHLGVGSIAVHLMRCSILLNLSELLVGDGERRYAWEQQSHDRPQIARLDVHAWNDREQHLLDLQLNLVHGCRSCRVLRDARICHHESDAEDAPMLESQAVIVRLQPCCQHAVDGAQIHGQLRVLENHDQLSRQPDLHGLLDLLREVGGG